MDKAVKREKRKGKSEEWAKTGEKQRFLGVFGCLGGPRTRCGDPRKSWGCRPKSRGGNPKNRGGNPNNRGGNPKNEK